jgi:hypothetical protein
MPPGPGEEGGTAGDSKSRRDSTSIRKTPLLQDLYRQRRVQELQDSGPRVFYEALVEIERGALADDVLDRFTRIPAETYRALGADQFPLPPVRFFRRAP